MRNRGTISPYLAVSDRLCGIGRTYAWRALDKREFCTGLSQWGGRIAFYDHLGAVVCRSLGDRRHGLVLLWFIAALGRASIPPPTITAEYRAVGVKELWRPVLIVLIGELLFQAVAMTERSFASGLGTGKIAAFFYAGSVVAVPLALFAAPVNTTLFPKLARAFRAGFREGRHILIRYGTVLFGVTLLCSLFIALVSEPLVELALARGKFSTADAKLTANILSILVWGLPFASLYGVIRNSFYSLSDYRTPIAGHGIRWVTLILWGNWLIPLFGVEGLALSCLAAQVMDTSMLGWFLLCRLLALSEAT
jgi:peptidoglycan biosynthesis protein MviN/MurJ (putative lipid II flippase)